MYKKLTVFLISIGLIIFVLVSCNLTPKTSNSRNVSVTPVTTNIPEEGLAETETWVRVNIVSRFSQDQTTGKILSLEGVTLCQADACYSIAHPTKTNLSQVHDSIGTPLASAVIPSGKYTGLSLQLSIQQSDGAMGLISETIAFQEPVTLQSQLRTDIFLALEPATSHKAGLRFLASGLVAPDVTAPFVFEPGYATILSLPSGFRLELSDNSLDTPTVFSWSEHDVLDLSPFYMFFPEVTLKQPAKVTIPIDMGRMPENLSLSDFQLQLHGDMTTLPALRTLSTAAITSNLLYELPVLNTFKMTSTQPSVQTSDGKSYGYPRPTDVLMPADADVSACARTLATNLNSYINTLRASPPTLRIMDCEAIAPFVHIIMVDLSSNFLAPLGNKNRWGRIAFPTSKNAQGQYLLKTISEHASSVSAIAAINGFTWAGNKGNGPNQTGTFQSTTYIKGGRCCINNNSLYKGKH